MRKMKRGDKKGKYEENYEDVQKKLKILREHRRTQRQEDGIKWFRYRKREGKRAEWRADGKKDEENG